MKRYFEISYSVSKPVAWMPGTSNFTWSFYVHAVAMPNKTECKKLVLLDAYIPKELEDATHNDIVIHNREDVGIDPPELSYNQVVVEYDDEETSEI